MLTDNRLVSFPITSSPVSCLICFWIVSLFFFHFLIISADLMRFFNFLSVETVYLTLSQNRDMRPVSGTFLHLCTHAQFDCDVFDRRKYRNHFVWIDWRAWIWFGFSLKWTICRVFSVENHYSKSDWNRIWGRLELWSIMNLLTMQRIACMVSMRIAIRSQWPWNGVCSVMNMRWFLSFERWTMKLPSSWFFY